MAFRATGKGKPAASARPAADYESILVHVGILSQLEMPCFYEELLLLSSFFFLLKYRFQLFNKRLGARGLEMWLDASKRYGITQ